MRRLVPLVFAVLFWALLVPLCGCQAKTDLTKVGGEVSAQWDDGPKVGANVSAGKHEVEIAPPFGPGLSGDAPPPSPQQAPAPPSAPAGYAPSPVPSTDSGLPWWMWGIALSVFTIACVAFWQWLQERKATKEAKARRAAESSPPVKA